MKRIRIIRTINLLFLTITIFSCENREFKVIPKVETFTVSNVTERQAKITGKVIDAANGLIDYGHCWSTKTNPTVNDNKTSFGDTQTSCNFESSLNNLEPGTKYYVRAYATDGKEIFYGREEQFTTISLWVWKSLAKSDFVENAIGFSIDGKGYVGIGHYKNEAYTPAFMKYDPAYNAWTQIADPHYYAEGAVGLSLGDKGYMGTGSFNGIQKTFWEYNPATNKWTQKSNITGPERVEAVSFSIGSKGYVGTGRSSTSTALNDFWQYNPSSDSWTQLANFPGEARSGSVGFSIGTKGYVGTGQYGNTWYKDFYEYNPQTNTWTRAADFGGAARSDAIGFSVGTRGYIGTGQNGILQFKDFWEYDQQMNSWTQKTDFEGGERYGAIGFSIGNKGYIGNGKNGFSYNYNSKIYDDLWEIIVK